MVKSGQHHGQYWSKVVNNGQDDPLKTGCHLHQLVNLRHGLGVLDGGGGLGPVQVLNVLDPLVNNLT